MRCFVRAAAGLIAALLLGGGFAAAQRFEPAPMISAPMISAPAIAAPAAPVYQPDLGSQLAAPSAATAQPLCTYRDANGYVHSC